MTLFKPGHKPPHVTMAALVVAGSKYSDGRTPARTKPRLTGAWPPTRTMSPKITASLVMRLLYGSLAPLSSRCPRRTVLQILASRSGSSSFRCGTRNTCTSSIFRFVRTVTSPMEKGLWGCPSQTKHPHTTQATNKAKRLGV